MQVELFYVSVPDATTRNFQVPEYDVPVIKAIWKPDLQPGKRIEVQASGIVRHENYHQALTRMKREYAMHPRGSSVAAWKLVYPTENDVEDAYREAVAETEAMLAGLANPVPTESEDLEMGETTVDPTETMVPPAKRRKG